MSPSVQSQHIHEHELELYLKAQLTAELVAAVNTHLERCQMCVDKLVEQDKCLWYMAELTAEATSKEKRRHPRLATDEPASIQILNPFSTEIREIRIIDVSQSGVRAYTRSLLKPGSLIRVTMPLTIACGDVRYCVAAEDGFHAGVRLHDYFVR